MGCHRTLLVDFIKVYCVSVLSTYGQEGFPINMYHPLTVKEYTIVVLQLVGKQLWKLFWKYNMHTLSYPVSESLQKVPIDHWHVSKSIRFGAATVGLHAYVDVQWCENFWACHQYKAILEKCNI